MKSAARRARAESVRGHRAGIVSRVGAGGIDLVVVWILVFVSLFAFAVVRYMLGEGTFRLPHTGAMFTVIAFPVMAIIYLTATWSGSGRSFGKSLVGLRVVCSDGTKLKRPRAFCRAVFCTFLGGPSLLWVAFSRRNMAVHDILLHTAVVYDWSDAVRAPAAPAAPTATAAPALDYTASS